MFDEHETARIVADLARGPASWDAQARMEKHEFQARWEEHARQGLKERERQAKEYESAQRSVAVHAQPWR
jgi:hypothetical protein